jgi:hypothetical protein
MPGMEGQDGSTERASVQQRVKKVSGLGNVGGNAAGGVGCTGLLFCSSKNDSPNKASPHKVGTSPEKGGEKRKSPSQGNSGVAIRPPLSTRLPPAPWLTHSAITLNLPLQCRGVHDGFFGKALTFAAKTMYHTANKLQQWAMEPDLGVKSFTGSILLTSRSICLLYHGVLVNRAHNPCDGLVFHAISWQRPLDNPG